MTAFTTCVILVPGRRCHWAGLKYHLTTRAAAAEVVPWAVLILYYRPRPRRRRWSCPQRRWATTVTTARRRERWPDWRTVGRRSPASLMFIYILLCPGEFHWIYCEDLCVLRLFYLFEICDFNKVYWKVFQWFSWMRFSFISERSDLWDKGCSSRFFCLF